MPLKRNLQVRTWQCFSRYLRCHLDVEVLTSTLLSICLSGIKHEWQVNGLDDIKDRSTLGEKLGGNVVVSLEGKPL